MNMESNNFNDLYAQLLHWCKETDGQLRWEQAPHFNEVYNGLLTVFFRSHAQLIKKYRTTADGETTCVGTNEEAEHTAHNAIGALLVRFEQGAPEQDPIAFVKQQARAYFVEMHPAAAYPELWSPEYEKLRQKITRFLSHKYRASEADAEEAVDFGFEKVFNLARKQGNPFKVSLKAYLKKTIVHAFLDRQKKMGRETPADPLPSNPSDDLEDDTQIINETDALWQSSHPAPDEQLHQQNLGDTLLKLIPQLSPKGQTVVVMSYMTDPTPTDEDIAATIGVTVGTLRSYYRHEAMNWLREQLALSGYGHFGLNQRGEKQERVFRRS